jgi:hypothetical protein
MYSHISIFNFQFSIINFIQILDVMRGDEGCHSGFKDNALTVNEVIGDDDRQQVVVIQFSTVGDDQCLNAIFPHFLYGKEHLQLLLGTVVDPLIE